MAKVKSENAYKQQLRSVLREYRPRKPIIPEFASDWDRRIASYAFENGFAKTAKHFGVELKTVEHLLRWFMREAA